MDKQRTTAQDTAITAVKSNVYNNKATKYEMVKMLAHWKPCAHNILWLKINNEWEKNTSTITENVKKQTKKKQQTTKCETTTAKKKKLTNFGFISAI